MNTLNGLNQIYKMVSDSFGESTYVSIAYWDDIEIISQQYSKTLEITKEQYDIVYNNIFDIIKKYFSDITNITLIIDGCGIMAEYSSVSGSHHISTSTNIKLKDNTFIPFK